MDAAHLPDGAARYVGPYRLLEQVGEGGMGIVHLAESPAGERVAVKVLRAHLATDAVGRERLAREVRSMRRVHGPHVAEVLDADVDADLPYVVTRYVPGRPLDEIVRDHGSPAPNQLLRLAHGLADALASIHAAGVVHRDLKPGNVLLTGGVPTVIDFGIAQIADDAALTSTGLFIGTPGYFAPEIARGERATPASDIASWAATVTFAATGRPPYGRGPVEVVLARVADSRYDLSGVPHELVPLLAAALAPDPQRRPTGAELRERLAALLAGGGISADPVPEPATIRIPATAYPIRPGTRLLTQVPAPAAPNHDRGPVHGAALVGAAPQGYGPPPTYPAVVGAAPDRPREAPAAVPQDRPRRGGLLALCLLAVLAGVTAIAPIVGAGVLAAVLVLLSIADRSAGFVDRRRASFGRRGTDWPVAIGALPWQAVRAAVAAVLAVAIAAVPAVAAGSAVLVLNGRSDIRTALFVATAVLAVAAWWGPGGRHHRGGVGRLAHRLGAPGRALVTAMLVAAAVVAFATAATGPARWWPSTPPAPGTVTRVLAQLPQPPFRLHLPQLGLR